MSKEVDVCIVGGGPAGLVLALLLAKQGIKVLVLEQHKDFDREYRGEVLMPRFTQMMRQIGIFSELEKRHHIKLQGLEGYYREKRFLNIDFKSIAPEAPFALWMPQPILLNFLHERAKQFPQYEILFDACAKSLITEGATIKGVTAQNEKGERIEVRAKITVGADGRFSVLRRTGDFEVADEDYRFDIVWFSMPRPDDYDNQVKFFLNPTANFLILPKYPDLIQCGLVVPKGGYAKLRHDGIESVKKILLQGHRYFQPFAERLRDFSHFSVLQARIEYVKEWARDGALLVGDAAHTCSPAGAIGVSVATASAVVAAEVIADALAANDVSAKKLSRLQEIREKEVREIQRAQKNFTRLFLAPSSFTQRIFPFAMGLLGRTGLLQAFQRRMFVMDKPLPVRKTLHF